MLISYKKRRINTYERKSWLNMILKQLRTRSTRQIDKFHSCIFDSCKTNDIDSVSIAQMFQLPLRTTKLSLISTMSIFNVFSQNIKITEIVNPIINHPFHSSIVHGSVNLPSLIISENKDVSMSRNGSRKKRMMPTVRYVFAWLRKTAWTNLHVDLHWKRPEGTQSQLCTTFTRWMFICY